MTADQYVENVIAKYAVPRGQNSPAEKLGATVAGPIRTWAGQYLENLMYSGSYAKQTGVHGASDVDLFISIKSDLNQPLKEIYSSLYNLALKQRWEPREQNVSVGITVNGTRADLVPGKIQEGYKNYHSLYLRKRDSWTQTNVNLHVDTVSRSDRLREIRAVKIWRLLHGLDFPSLYLELFTIQALSGHSKTTLADNVLHTLKTIGTSLPTTRIDDPANTNNILSDDITKQEKEHIAGLATISAKQQSWGDIIW